MVSFLNSRRKAIVAALGFVVNLLYVYQVAHPNPYVSSALAILAILGVHQTTNA